MRYFGLVGFQHVVLFAFPTLILIILLYVAFAKSHFHKADSEERKKKIVHSYPAGIESTNSPFPLILILLIAGFLLWTFFFILGSWHWGVKI